MKALNRITGRIIDVIYDERCFQYIDKDGNNYVSCELDFDFENSINWDQRRFELAKAALNGMLAHSRNGHGYHPRDPKMHWHDAIAEEAIEIADAVIAKLKEK